MSYRPGDSAGPYYVLQLIGRGAFGEVLLGQDLRRHDHYVAIKTVCCDMTEQYAALTAKDTALAEAALLRRLRHPNIVRCEDTCWDSERSVVWLALEYMDGGSLQAFIESQRQTGRIFDSSVIRKVLVALGTALQYIHSEGVLHRDVKPANVLLTHGTHQVKLADFGISKILEATGRALTVVGTPYYFSPEIVSGHAYGPASDAWSLGVCLHEMSSLRRPFEASNPLALARRICEENPPVLPLGIDLDIEHAVTGLLQKDPVRRITLQQMLALSDPIRVLAQETGGIEAPLVLPESIVRVNSTATTGIIEEIIEDLPPSASPIPPQVSSAISSTEKSLSSGNTQKVPPSPRGAFVGPEEKKQKKEKKEKSTGRRWFRFRAGFTNKTSVAKEDTPDDEVTMVSAFTENDDSDSPSEEVIAATPYSHRSKEDPHSGHKRTMPERLERIDSGALPGRATSAISKAWF